MDEKTILEDLGIVNNEIKESAIEVDEVKKEIIFINLANFYKQEKGDGNI